MAERIRNVRRRDEPSLIARAHRGDPAAAAQLFEYHWPDAWRTAFAVTADRALADDVAQVAMIRAFGSLAEFDTARPFGPWLRKIVTCSAIDGLRARARAPAIGLPAYDMIAGWDEAADLDGRIAAAVVGLDEDRRVVVVLKYWVDLSVEEIASLLETPVGTVASRLSRALAELRGTIEEESHERQGL
jgi:RNA polymerase sigma-70 factor (ECF subfamily)